MTQTVEQRDAALRRANAIRLTRARRKRDIYAMTWDEGMEEVARLLLELPEDVGGARVLEMLSAPRRMGRKRALTVLVRAQVSESKRLRDLTERQRTALADVLRASAAQTRREREKRERLRGRAA